MIQSSSPVRHRRGLAWLLFLIALVEAAVIVAFVADRALATMACGAVGAIAPALAQAAVGAAGGMPLDAQPQGPVPSIAETASPQGEVESASPAPTTPATEPDAAQSTGAVAAPASSDAPVEGDTNQIVDPKCVANAAVAALQASPPPSLPSCGPMKQPEALKAAEKQVAP